MSHDNRIRLDVGTRVRNWTQEYPEARENGTAIIVDVIGQHTAVDNTWEYTVRTDAGDLRQWNMVDVPTRH